MNKYEFRNPLQNPCEKSKCNPTVNIRNKCNEAFIQKHVKTKPQIPTLVAGHPTLGHLQGRVEKQSVR